MTDTPQTNTDIADYRLAVERHLADLPAPIREDLLNGLEEHLAEVSADLEPGVPLSHLLGGPEAYARELRETVETPRERLSERFRRNVVEPAAGWAKGMSDRFAKGAGFGEFADLRKALKPGWWVLRGVIAGVAALYFLISLDEGIRNNFLYNEGLLWLFALGSSLLFVWLSLRLGVRSQRWGRRSQWLVAVAGLGLCYVGYTTVASFVGGTLFNSFIPTAAVDVDNASYNGVRDVYVYSEDGELLTDVYLFDQNGDPLWIGDASSCDDAVTDPFAQETEPPGQGSSVYGYDPRYGYLYPLCMPEDGSTGLPGPDEAATSSPPDDGESPTTPVWEPSGESPTNTTQD